jgi:hypothetical protein
MTEEPLEDSEGQIMDDPLEEDSERHDFREVSGHVMEADDRSYELDVASECSSDASEGSSDSSSEDWI